VDEVARLLGLRDRGFPSGEELRDLPERLHSRGQLTFRQLAELHVLTGLTGCDRSAWGRGGWCFFDEPLKRLRQEWLVAFPLSSPKMMTEEGRLFALARLADSQKRACAEKALLAYLDRFDRDEDGTPSRLYPFTTNKITEGAPKLVVLDPRVSFGRPCLAGTGIPTEVIRDRFAAGESIEALAQDYRRSAADIEAGLRFELRAR
jgi:uncharacterized protein (DUF433 family)